MDVCMPNVGCLLAVESAHIGRSSRSLDWMVHGHVFR